jgi:hypothetical protein
MKFRGGEFSTGTMRNFQPELTGGPPRSLADPGHQSGPSLARMGSQGQRLEYLRHLSLRRAADYFAEGFRDCRCFDFEIESLLRGLALETDGSALKDILSRSALIRSVIEASTDW